MSTTYQEPIPYNILANGDSALTIEFEFPIGETLSRKIYILANMLEKQLGNDLLEIIPAYQNLTVVVDLTKISLNMLEKSLTKILQQPLPEKNFPSKLIQIPVCYGGQFGADIEYISEKNNLSINELIQLHCQPQYLVHMLGFTPGFLYLGGLNSKLFCCRKSTPAIKVLAGSVGIGGEQTGIYPQATPGGWQIIGRTPKRLFTPQNEKPFIAQPLDKIEFIAINESQFKSLNEYPE